MGAENTVTIALKAKGIKSVTDALSGARNTIIKLEQGTTVAAQAASKKRISIAKAEAKERAKIAADLDRSMTGGTNSRATRGLSPSTRTPPNAAVSNAVQGSGMSLAGAGVAGAAFGLVTKGIDMVTNALSQFGGFLVHDIVKPQFALEKFATQLQNSSAGAVKAQTVMDRSRAIQARWNIDAMDAAQAAATVADKTGDMKTAFDSVETNAMLSQGYGASMDELSELSAAIYNLDQSMGASGLQKAMFTQLAQGQIAGGRFTIKDIAGLGGELVKKAALLGGDSQTQLSSLGAALQTGGITGKADVSMTNLNSFISEAAAKLKGTKENGKDIVKNGKVMDLGAAIRAVLIATKGDAGKLKQMQYSDTGQSALLNYMGIFQKALQKGATSAEAAAEATAVFEQMKGAVANEKSVREAANAVMMTAGERYNTAMNAIKDKLYGLMPQISVLVKGLADKAPLIGSAAMTLAKTFIALADLFSFLIPEFDTRTKKAMAKEEKKLRISSESAQANTDIENIDKELADLEANKRITPSAVYASKKQYLEDQKAAKQAQVKSLGEKYAALEAPEVSDTHESIVDMLVKSGKAKDGEQGRSAEEIAAFLERSGDVTLKGNAATEGMSPELIDRLERYRDDQRTKREKSEQDAATTSTTTSSSETTPVDTEKVITSADRLTESLNKVADAADKGIDKSRTTPLSQR